MTKYFLGAAAAAAFLMVGGNSGAVAAVAPICKMDGVVVECPEGLADMNNANWYYEINVVSQTTDFSDPYQNNPNSNSWFHDCLSVTTLSVTLTNPGGQQNWGSTEATEEDVTGSKNVNADASACN